MASRFFNEDLVALNAAPDIVGVVEHTWRDIDSAAFQVPDDWIRHPEIPKATFDQCEREGRVSGRRHRFKQPLTSLQPPTDHVIVRFVDPYGGATLLRENLLVLKDRGLVVGDVVKRQPSDPASGSVIRTSTSCTIRPVYTDLPYHGATPWPYKPADGQITVPEEELQFPDFQLGDHIIYHDWVGEVMDVFEEVTVRLGNGSVVRVQNAEELEVPDAPPEVLSNTRGLGLVQFLRSSRARLDQMAGKGPTVPADYFYPGQRVSTKKANLRLGTWIIGSYSPSVAPKGIVVEVRVFQISVNWIASNLSDSERTGRPEPWEMIDGDQLNEVKLYNRNNTTSVGGGASNQSHIGSSQGHGVAVSDYVKFRDVAGAALKYSADSPHRDSTGIFRRIPRTMTQGFEMNIFQIRNTTSTVWVQWQDGSITEENSTKLLPYLNVDDHDLWVGEICSLKSKEVREDGVIAAKEVGVVQSVNAQERTARVRWFQYPKVRIFQDRTSVIVPGTVFGPLSDRESSVSVYEVVAYSALTKRRGDLVLIFPNAAVLAGRSTHALYYAADEEQGRSMIGNLGILASNMFRNTSDDPQNISARDQVRWFGEIIDLGLDGLVTVRLGASSPVEDIRVPVERILTVVGGDDPDFYSEGGPSEDDYNSEASDFGSAGEVIEETVEYEGGTRLDDDADDDAWMTDGEDEKAQDERNGGQHRHELPAPFWMSEIPNGNAHHATALHQTNGNVPSSTATPKKTPPDIHEEYRFTSFPGMPPQFEILDESPPLDHHYLPKATRLSASLLRRVRKEHAILTDSLPPGIWVRTWSDRLDLLRILIIGPRGTPYELAPFVLDVHLREDFPLKPPEVYFHSWTFGVGRINPNLYEEGTVCLSVLGTWPEGEKHEAWNPERSSIFQVLVSLLGLVLVAEPYYSESRL